MCCVRVVFVLCPCHVLPCHVPQDRSQLCMDLLAESLYNLVLVLCVLPCHVPEEVNLVLVLCVRLVLCATGSLSAVHGSPQETQRLGAQAARAHPARRGQGQGRCQATAYGRLEGQRHRSLPSAYRTGAASGEKLLLPGFSMHGPLQGFAGCRALLGVAGRCMVACTALQHAWFAARSQLI